jgi:hypothetical protein
MAQVARVWYSDNSRWNSQVLCRAGVAEADEAAQDLVEEMERRKPGVRADLNASKTKARWIAARPAPWGREADRLDRCVPGMKRSMQQCDDAPVTTR